MKKTFIAICCIAFILSFSSAAFAADSAQTTPGDQITITTTATGLSNFAFSPSPRVGVEIKTSASAYALTSANSLTSATNGMEYGTKNTAVGYALKTKTTAAGALTANGPTEPTDETTLGGTGWIWQGAS
jgi:predicted GNAT superfamily acetyltransferase